MAKYQQYEKYKESGVEWLGDIPSHWEISSLKRCVDGCTNGIWGSEPEESSDNTVVLRVADFDRNKLEISEEKLTLRNISPKESESRLLKRGDLLVEKSGGGDKTLVGCVVLFNKDFRAVTSNFVAKMTPKIGYESSFLKYAFSLLYDGRVNYASIKQTTGIQNLDSDAYLMEKFVFPEKEEQTQIANFLDHETAQIDTLIEKQQTLIQLLKEKRQAVISHAVTKGLNPDAPMKDSGVEWLGEVPEHWTVSFVKYIVLGEKDSMVDGPFGSSVNTSEDYVDDGIPVIRTVNITNNGFSSDNLKFMRQQKFDQLKRHSVKPGDVLFSKVGTIGNACLLPSDIPEAILSTTGSCKISVDQNKIKGEYLVLMFHLMNQTLMEMANSNVQPFLNMSNIKNLKISLPSIEEQKNILTYLEEKLEGIDDLISKSLSFDKLIRERRTALISAAVTGKIDVRGWVAPE